MPLSLRKQFLSFIENSNFPCIGAKAAVKKKAIRIMTAKDLFSSEADCTILERIYRFIEEWQKHQESLQTLAVIFENPKELCEIEFEEALWMRLQSLHNIDSETYAWDPRVSFDVRSPNFCLSLGGKGFFVVGMHAQSSRAARRFSHPVLVFNLHEQFEKIRKEGVFARFRDKIRENDEALSGSINPMVNDFGKESEALQYSGRQVSSSHHCPFLANHQNYEWQTIPPRQGVAFALKKGAILVVQDPYGEQVADLFCFSSQNKDEFLSSGRSIDYANKLFFSTSDVLYSNFSQKC